MINHENVKETLAKITTDWKTMVLPNDDILTLLTEKKTRRLWNCSLKCRIEKGFSYVEQRRNKENKTQLRLTPEGLQLQGIMLKHRGKAVTL